jgi:SSS family solute:Na+ symporter
MMSAYFSAIMSTADSCLMAASGNVVTDLLPRSVARLSSASKRWNVLRLSQLATLLIGVLALALATRMQNVLELMLYSYAFMVSGLFVPVLMALFGRKPSSSAALVAMVGGGATTLALIAADVALPLGLDANLFGIAASAMLYFTMKKIDDGTKS